MGDISDIKKDLPMSMTMAAFSGISWYVGVEINTSLFMRFKRRRGLYFWACALGSWGVILQPLFIILADFGVWRHLTGSITMIYLTWMMMVVPQSWVLYSRLHLIMHEETALRWIKFVLLFNSVVFSVPTIIIGTLSQTTQFNPKLPDINTVWDRLQLIVFFVQETTLSVLYIHQARKFLRDSSLLDKPYSSSSVLSPSQPPNQHHPRSGNSKGSGSGRSSSSSGTETSQVLRHLIYTNVLVIALDIALLGIQSAGLFYLQGAFKPCVYGVKLKIEFVILNRLIKSLRSHGGGGRMSSSGAHAYRSSESYPRHPNAGAAGAAPGPSAASPGYRGGDSGGSGGGFWTRHTRRRSATTDVEDGGEQVWLSHLERGKGTRSRSQESQSPILDREVGGIDTVPRPGDNSGIRGPE